jgi:NADH:ubiquinone oxidoreductase subunit E
MKVQVCQGKSCKDRFSKYIITRLENDTKFYQWKNVEVIEEMCMNHCKKWPNIKIKNQVINYTNPAKASELVAKGLLEEAKKYESKKKK